MTDLSLNACTPRQRTSIWGQLTQWRALAKQRRDLAQLDPHALCDIGITQKQAQSEAQRPVWDAPNNWTR